VLTLDVLLAHFGKLFGRGLAFELQAGSATALVRGGDGHAPANTLGMRHLAFVADDIDAAVATVRARARSGPSVLAPRTYRAERGMSLGDLSV